MFANTEKLRSKTGTSNLPKAIVCNDDQTPPCSSAATSLSTPPCCRPRVASRGGVSIRCPSHTHGRQCCRAKATSESWPPSITSTCTEGEGWIVSGCEVLRRFGEGETWRDSQAFTGRRSASTKDASEPLRSYDRGLRGRR